MLTTVESVRAVKVVPAHVNASIPLKNKYHHEGSTLFTKVSLIIPRLDLGNQQQLILNTRNSSRMPTLPKATLLLLFVHGFKGHDLHTFLDFPTRIMTILTNTKLDLDVESIVYPQYDTRGDFNVNAVKRRQR